MSRDSSFPVSSRTFSPSNTNPFADVRRACAEVADVARLVHIDAARLREYAASLAIARLLTPEMDAAIHYLGHGPDTVSYFLTLDAINFGSGYFPQLHKPGGRSGYTLIASSLTRTYEDRGPLSAEHLSQMTPADCAAMLGQELDGGPVTELMSLFAKALSDLGRYLLWSFDGTAAAMIEAAAGSAARLVQLVRPMPFFNDVQIYGGLAVPFFKRAQLAVADLAVAFHTEGYGRFDDLHELTIFADNLVPHVLRVDGVLQYDDVLLRRIEAGMLVPVGSPAEVEIRAVAVHAVELIRRELVDAGHAITSMQLDNLLWHRGQGHRYKALPRHRTRTVYY